MRKVDSGPTLLGVWAGLIALFVIVGACAGADGTPPGHGPTSPTSYSGTWILTEGRGTEGEVPLVKGYRITLFIDSAEVGGTAACNSYGGAVNIKGESFTLKQGLAMTEIGCDPEVMESEAAYVGALSDVNRIARKGHTLTLAGPDSELHFELSRPLPIAKLTDTNWRLVSLIETPGAEKTATSAAPARLTMDSNGELSGSTGCRRLEGEWIQRGDEILFATLGAEGDCPPDLQQQDSHVLGVLGDGFTAEIEDQRLLLVSRGGLGLYYSAESKR